MLNDLVNYTRRANSDSRVPTIFDLFTQPLNELDTIFAPVRTGFDSMKVDLRDLGDRYELKADMPGVAKEDIKVDFDDGVLTVSARHHSETKDENKDSGYMLRERTEGVYERSFRFESDINAQDISAGFTDGVLSITLKKAVHEEKKTSISIN